MAEVRAFTGGGMRELRSDVGWVVPDVICVEWRELCDAVHSVSLVEYSSAVHQISKTPRGFLTSRVNTQS